MSTAEQKANDPIIQFVKKSGTVLSLDKMPGDASHRQYYRVVVQTKDDESRSMVVMKMEPFSERGNEVPFISIQRHLETSGVDVPRVIDSDPKQGMILLEDLGDETLLRNLQTVQSADEEQYRFEHAIDALVNMHGGAGPSHATPESKKAIEGFALRFDVEKLMWEVNYTIEHFYEKHLSRKFSIDDAKVMQDGFHAICTEIASQPTVFTHRDYHSRNIMIAESTASEQGRYVMIDFQDARMGPPSYDLASLLRDSYYQLDEAQVKRLVRYYHDQALARDVPLPGLDEFSRSFDLMAVQRNFKAIGSFASFLNRRGDPSYLKFIGNTFENIRRNLFKYPEYTRLREVLYHYYYF